MRNTCQDSSRSKFTKTSKRQKKGKNSALSCLSPFFRASQADRKSSVCLRVGTKIIFIVFISCFCLFCYNLPPRRFSRSARSLFSVAFSFFTSVNFYPDLAAVTLISFTHDSRAKNSNAQSRRIKVLQYYAKDANRVLEN